MNFNTKPQIEYTLELQKSNNPNSWSEVETRYLLNTTSSNGTSSNYFIDSIPSETPTIYRAICTFNDSSIVSNDTTLVWNDDQLMSIYPNPATGRHVYIKNTKNIPINIQLTNSLGALCPFTYDNDLKRLTLTGYRQELYILKVNNQVFKLVLSQ